MTASGVRRWNAAGIAFLVFLGVMLARSIWGRTGDLVGDFGREMYVPWQLSQGRVLYRDVEYVFGPIPPYWNSLWLRVLGNDISSVLIANSVVLGGVVLLLFVLLRAISDTFTALVATAFFLANFAFASATDCTNYNFLTPYCHGMTMGLLASLACVGCLGLFHRSAKSRYAVFGGFLLGTTLLMKGEIFVACFAAYWLGLAASLWTGRWLSPSPSTLGEGGGEGGRPNDAQLSVDPHPNPLPEYKERGLQRPAKVIFLAVIAMLTAPVLAWLMLTLAMKPDLALQGVLGGLQFAGRDFVVSTPFYRQSMGILDIGQSFRAMFWSAGIYAIALGPIVLLGVLLRRAKVAGIWIGVICAVGLFYLAFHAGWNRPDFRDNRDRALPILVAIISLATAWNAMRARRIETCGTRAILQFSFSILALALLAKMILNARTLQYGFVLAAPAMLLGIVAMTSWIPTALSARNRAGIIVRLGVIGLLIAVSWDQIATTQIILERRPVHLPLASGGSWQALAMDQSAAEVIEWLQTNNRGGTLAVLPDACGINYCTGQANSVPYIELNPMVMRMWGEDRVLRDFGNSPPNAIVVLHEDTSFVGPRTLGTDYGLQLVRWIEQNYRFVRSFNDPQNEQFDCWVRKDWGN